MGAAEQVLLGNKGGDSINHSEWLESFQIAVASNSNQHIVANLSCCTTGKPYVSPLVDLQELIARHTTAEVVENIDEGIVGREAVPPTAKLISELLSNTATNKEKEYQKVLATGTQAWMIMWNSISPTIQAQLEPEDAYINANALHPKPVFELWKLIEKKFAGGGPTGQAVTSQEKERKQTNFDLLKQATDMALTVFYKIYIRALDQRNAVGHPPYAQRELASKFFSKLNSSYDEMRREMENHERLALQLGDEPRVFTLSQAVEYARGYISSPSTKPAAAKTISAFTAAVGEIDADVIAALVAKEVDKRLAAFKRGGGGAGGGAGGGGVAGGG